MCSKCAQDGSRHPRGWFGHPALRLQLLTSCLGTPWSRLALRLRFWVEGVQSACLCEPGNKRQQKVKFHAVLEVVHVHGVCHFFKFIEQQLNYICPAVSQSQVNSVFPIKYLPFMSRSRCNSILSRDSIVTLWKNSFQPIESLSWSRS